MATQRQPQLVDVARAGLTVAVAFSLVRVFAGGFWLAAAIVAAAAPHMIVTIASRRRWHPAATLATVVLGAVAFSAYVVEPHTLASGLPTAETVRAWADDLVRAPEILRRAVVPVAPAGGALLLALVALWAGGALTEWSARRLDASLGALGPGLVLFVAMAALGDGSWWFPTAAYALAAVLYLLALHGAEFGDHRSWFHSASRRRSRLLAGGAGAAAGAVLVALVVGPLLPGARSEALFDYRALGDKSGSGLLRATTPIVDIQAKLRNDPDRVVFTVRSPQPAYWRVIALDRYDGTLWTLDDEGTSADRLPARLEQPTSRFVEQRFRIVATDPHWLPAAYRPVGISLAQAKVVPESLTLYLEDGAPISGLRYDVTSQIAVPSPEERAAARPVEPAAFARYLELPSGFPERVRELARDVAGSEAGPYAQAIALQQHLAASGEFTYNLDVAQAEDIDTLEAFLFDVKEGYCEQFSIAFAAMARAIGLPTRIAVGYTTGDAEPGGLYRVRNKHAHSWPEVYLEGIGWAPFEPTPGRFEPTLGTGTGRAPDGSSPATPTTAPDAQASPGTTAPDTTVPTTTPRDGQVSVEGRGEPTDTRGTTERLVRNVVALLVAAAVAFVTLVGALAIAAVGHTRRRRHARDPRARVIGAWNEAIERLADAGIEAKRSVTPSEFARRHAPARGAGAAGAPLVRLAQLQTEALFAPGEPAPEAADDAWAQADAIDRALRKQVPRLRRLRRRLDPRGARDDADAYA